MADNPFVSLDPVPAQVVTIRPMNEPGLPGTPAPHVKIQYSVDGVTNWHDAPTSEDKYFRMSTDDGATWGGAVYCGNTADAEIARIAAEAARDKAAQWAENPEDVEVEAGQYSALHHKEKALDAQVAAAASATAASTSEGNALASENKAHKWAENPEDVEVETGQYSALHHKEKALDAQVAAEAARDKAVQWAENPEDVEVEAGQYSALHHKEKALDAQAAAAASATAASTSEGNALASENKAHQWAEEAEDIEVQTGEYSAYHWAKKAEAAAPPAVEDQIVDGAIYKAPSQNAVYDALTAKTDKSTLTTKGDLYIRNATDITRLPVGSDGEILMADSGETEGVRWTPLYATADASNVYERGSVPSIKGTSVAADRYTWVSPSGGLVVGINGAVYALTSQTELDLSNSAHWDTTSTDYTVAANRKGKDFYIYACEPSSGNTPVMLLSASSTYPAGYTADTSRKIGGFHCLCADVGTITGHPLSGFVAGDILPLSVWDLLHRPKSASPEGMVWCADANIWVDIYLQSGTGDTTASAYGATITDTRNWMDFVDDLGAVGKRLLDDGEFQKIAAGGNEETNIAGSADPGTTGGHIDTAGRRMISAIGCEDCAGVIYQWLSDQSFRSDYVSGWGWYDLPGAKGSLYNQDGVNGRADVKLRAGGRWDGGAACGSRCRDAIGRRWDANSYGGARGAAEPV